MVQMTLQDGNDSGRWRNHRLKELCRLRELVCDELINEVREYPDPRDFKNYFYFYAYTARKNR